MTTGVIRASFHVATHSLREAHTYVIIYQLIILHIKEPMMYIHNSTGQCQLFDMQHDELWV